MFCRNCGEEISITGVFCPNCGTKPIISEEEIPLPEFIEEEIPTSTEVIAREKNIKIFSILLSLGMVVLLFLPWLATPWNDFSAIQTLVRFNGTRAELEEIWDATPRRRAELDRSLAYSRSEAHFETTDRMLGALRTRAGVITALRFSMIIGGLSIFLVHLRAIYKMTISTGKGKVYAYKIARKAHQFSLFFMLLFLALAFYAISVFPWTGGGVFVSIAPWLAFCCSILGIIISNKRIKEIS